jgi:hypothetical protein
MLSNDAEVERLAREMIAKYGRRAAEVAIYKVNEMVDRENTKGRDLWASVVYSIRDRQGNGPAPDDIPRACQDNPVPARPKPE